LIGRLPDFIFDGEEGRNAPMSLIRMFRMIALAEGSSFLTLLCIAMPMKYFMGMPEVVRVVGSIHGGLFVLYVGLLAMLHFRQRWSFMFSLYAFVASIIPFGTFVLDKQLREKEVVAG
jgi:integral membrane protein